MARPLKELHRLTKAHPNAVVVCAGDIFDKWNSPPQLINWAIKNLPKMYAVPGQHDLPHHNYNDIRKSAYWTLVEAGVVEDLPPDHCRIILPDLALYGFPWECPIKPLKGTKEKKEMIHLAVVHAYCWFGSKKYPNAKRSSYVRAHIKRLRGFDAAVFGDNHKGFLTTKKDFSLLNCGGFMRRRIDEKEYKPMVGLLRRDGTIDCHFLETENDVLSIPKDPKSNHNDFSDFIGSLNEMYDLGLDFEQAVSHYLLGHELNPETVKAIRKVIDM